MHKQFIGSTLSPTGVVGVVKWQVAKVGLGRADSTHSLCSKNKNGRGRKLNGMSLFKLHRGTESGGALTNPANRWECTAGVRELGRCTATALTSRRAPIPRAQGLNTIWRPVHGSRDARRSSAQLWPPRP